MVDARRLDLALSTGVCHVVQDLLKLPTREAHGFVGETFRQEELLKVCFASLNGHSACLVPLLGGSREHCGGTKHFKYWLCTAYQTVHCYTLHRPRGQVGYGFVGDLRAIEARLGCLAAARPAVDLASLHRLLAVRGVLQPPQVGLSLSACLLLRCYLVAVCVFGCCVRQKQVWVSKCTVPCRVETNRSRTSIELCLHAGRVTSSGLRSPAAAMQAADLCLI